MPLIGLTVLGFLLSLAFQWPRPAAPGTAPLTSVGWGDVVDGTALSVPLVPFLVLVVATAVARADLTRGPAGAVIALGLMGILFLAAGIAAATNPNPLVPSRVLLVAGVIYAVLGLAVGAAAARAMRERLIAAMPKKAAPVEADESS